MFIYIYIHTQRDTHTPLDFHAFNDEKDYTFFIGF